MTQHALEETQEQTLKTFALRLSKIGLLAFVVGLTRA